MVPATAPIATIFGKVQPFPPAFPGTSGTVPSKTLDMRRREPF